jgi:hypothetical protein
MKKSSITLTLFIIVIQLFISLASSVDLGNCNVDFFCLLPSLSDYESKISEFLQNFE